MTFQTEFGEFGNNFYELYARGKFWFFIVFASIFVGSPIKWVQHRTRTQQIIAHILFKYFLFYCIVRVLCIHMYIVVELQAVTFDVPHHTLHIVNYNMWNRSCHFN